MSTFHPLFKQIEQQIQKKIEFLENDLRHIRTGKATPALIDELKVDYYGTPTLLKQLAVISTPDPRTLLIRPYDATALAAVEKTILASELGLNPHNDGKVIRLPIPPLSEERRQQYTHLVKQHAENAKVSIRNIRRDGLKEMEKQKKEGLLSEDTEEKLKKDIQEFITQSEKRVDTLIEKKNKEILES